MEQRGLANPRRIREEKEMNTSKSRKAGDKLLQTIGASGLAGIAGAVAGDAIAHDDMDYMAQDFKDLQKGFAAMSPEAQRAYITITADNQLSGLDRALVSAALEGQIGPPKAIETEADRAIAQAVQLRAKAPGVAAEVLRLNQQELELVAKEIDFGTTPQAVMGAAQYEGAGVSPVPSLLGGGLAAAATALAMRRS